MNEQEIAELTRELEQRCVAMMLARVLLSASIKLLPPETAVHRFDEELTYEGQRYMERLADTTVRRQVAAIDAAIKRRLHTSG